MQVARCDYVVKTNAPKTNGQTLNQNDFINIGYMAGRFGVSLNGDLTQNFVPKNTSNGLKININSCTSDLFEKNLNEAGIKFDKIA
ncbi:MAG: hypothetical protein PHV37_04575 [Candidatus Gastranaerophilales bacterium]|nr:hypothetical protein [Candidatus Gastranaerophilales bacterium]